MEEDKLRLGVESQGDGQRLILKFKKAPDSNRVSGTAEKKEPQDQPVTMLSYACHCGKAFTSRKALGSHVRVHNRREDGVPLKKGTPEVVTARANLNQGVICCDICAKVFSSPKSLYGHMRKHPEREWRGMQPLKSGSSQSQSCHKSTESDAVKKVNDHIDGSSDTTVTGPLPESALLDLLKSLQRWPITGKRHQKSTVTKPEDLQDDMEAARTLLSLKNAVIRSSPAAPNIEPSSQCYFLTLTLGTANDNGKAEHADTEKQKKNNKKRSLGDPETTGNIDHDDDPTTTGTRFCNVCGKSFLTFQALGGHKSVHNKIRKTHCHSRPGHVPDPNNTSSHPHNETEMDRSDSSEDSHQCEICKRKFPTGQALGGHKRLHWTGSSPETNATTTGEASRTGQEEPRNFDLNKLPPTEDNMEVEDISPIGSAHIVS